MTRSQQASLNRIVEHHSVTTRSQLESGIEQVFSGTWSTARLKDCQAWRRLTEDQKQRLSRLVDRWLYERDGHKGCDTERALRAYYKPDHGSSTPIMPAKFVLCFLVFIFAFIKAESQSSIINTDVNTYDITVFLDGKQVYNGVLQPGDEVHLSTDGELIIINFQQLTDVCNKSFVHKPRRFIDTAGYWYSTKNFLFERDKCVTP